MSKIRIPGKLKVPCYIPRCHATIQKFPRYNFGLPSGGAGTPKTVPRYNPNSPTLQFSAPRGHPKITKINKSASPNHFCKTSENVWTKTKNIINLRTFLNPQNGAGAFIKHRFVHVDPAPKWHRNDIPKLRFLLPLESNIVENAEKECIRKNV